MKYKYSRKEIIRNLEDGLEAMKICISPNDFIADSIFMLKEPKRKYVKCWSCGMRLEAFMFTKSIPVKCHNCGKVNWFNKEHGISIKTKGINLCT